MTNPGRKFWLAMIAIVQAGLLVQYGAITATAYSAVVGTALLGYLGSNVAQKVWAPPGWHPEGATQPVKQG